MSELRPSANDELAAMVASKSMTYDIYDDEAELSWPCLLIRVGKRWCGMRAETVTEVVAPEAITHVPSQPDHILGVSLVHGRLVPVINVGPLMSDMDVVLASPPGRRLAVISQGDLELGLVADDAKGVIELPVPEPDPTATARPEFILGEVRWEDSLVCVLDVAKLVHVALSAE